MSVKDQHIQYANTLDKWNRCRDVANGQDAVHAAGEKYLPRLADQDLSEYAKYVLRTPFFNATWRTIAGLAGMLFRIPPKCEVAPVATSMLEDVTLSGHSLFVFAMQTAVEVLTVGRCGILVDYPTVDTTNTTLADAKRLNLRPTMALYKTESIINWDHRVVNNATVLSQVRLMEKRTTRVDEFKVKEELVYRVLDLDENNFYRVRVFIVDQNGNDVLIEGPVNPLMGGKPLTEIPFKFINPDDTTWNVDAPPLIDLVDMNLSHYRTSADLEHGAHFTGLPTPVISGHRPEKEGEKFYIGSMTAWVFPSADAKATYLEFKGDGLKTLAAMLDKKEQQMAVLGARMLEQVKRAVETAEVASIHRQGEQSMLASVAQAISIGIREALQIFSDWAGGDATEVTFDLNRDFFPMPMDSLTLTALVSAWQFGAISKQMLFQNLQDGDIIPQDADFETEEALIDAEIKKNQLTGGTGNTPPGGGGQPPGGGGGITFNMKSGGSGTKTVTGPNGQTYTIKETT